MPNCLIINDIQIHCEGHNGTRIASLRPVSPSELYKKPNGNEIWCEVARGPRRIFR